MRNNTRPMSIPIPPVGYAAMGETPAADLAALVGYAAIGFSLASDISALVGCAAMFPSVSVGQTLAYAGDIWTYAPSAIAVQWRRNGAPIPGATGQAYLLAVADVGALITVALIASNASGSSGAVISAEVGPVRAFA